MERIFIQIAAYRDPELKKTIKDALDKASHPERLVFSICHQHSPEDVWDDLDEWKDDPRFKITDVSSDKSKGTCWARHLLQQRYDGEEYTLQLDSHHRFDVAWDDSIINMYKQLLGAGYKKPLLTAYLCSYNPETDPEGRETAAWQLNFDRFSPEGILHTRPGGIDYWKGEHAVPARFYSAHFAFASGSFVTEVPHDPGLYFHGEEISIGVRAYTHGYDLFHPIKNVIWHEYTRNGKKRHWDDAKSSEWVAMNQRAHHRVRKLLGVGCEKEDLGIYGLGTVRTLEKYEEYAGVRFKDMTVQSYTLKFYPPPNPRINDKAEYDKSFTCFYKHCIDIQYSQVPEPDYDFWAVAFHAKDDSTIESSRRDATKEEIAGYFADPDKYCKVWREFYYSPSNPPAYWVVWPFSKSKGWCDKIIGRLDIPGYVEPILITPSKINFDQKNSSVEKYIPMHSNLTAEQIFTPEGLKFMRNLLNAPLQDSVSSETIFVHLPAYRDPELVPTIKDALAKAYNPKRIRFGVCRQYCETDGFDSLHEFKDDTIVKVYDVPYTEAKGLPWARSVINENLLDDEDYLLQLDSHHRFAQNWDKTLIDMHKGLEAKGVEKPILAGYLPSYTPKNDPDGRSMDPWFSQARCFYPFHTIFIGPTAIPNWRSLTEPIPSRFLCGHFDFARSQWGREILHDPDIYFAGEEINLTVRSYTHGYRFFHPHIPVIWHSTMREERAGMLKWDDDSKRGVDWWAKQTYARHKIRVLFGVDHPDIVIDPKYGLGNHSTIQDYERYAGVCFKDKSMLEYTAQDKFAPCPTYPSYEEFRKACIPSYYWVVRLSKSDFPNGFDQVLVAFDDIDGLPIKSYNKSIDEFRDGRLDYEEMFLSRKKPNRVVYWGILDGKFTSDRIEKTFDLEVFG